jgi:UDP-N-acetylglucosamine diphosphorylase/glucosamine-1-phosphate N-acetyltransferase
MRPRSPVVISSKPATLSRSNPVKSLIHVKFSKGKKSLKYATKGCRNIKMRIVVFEDDTTYNLEPLTLTKGVFDLRLGIFSFADRIKHYMQVEQLDFLSRDHIARHIRESRRARANEPEAIDDETLFVNGLLVFNNELRKMVQKIKPETVVLKEGRLVLARFNEAPAREVASLLMNAPGPDAVKSIKAKASEHVEYGGDSLITNFWEIIERNASQITMDYEAMPRLRSRIPVETRIIGKRKNVHIGKGSNIDPNVMLNVEKGPVYIGDDCEIRFSTFIEGPAYIGQGTIVHPFSIIREGSNIGPVCRVGGEIEETIMQGYSNKQHVGFLGHAYVGEWVNLGALFTNSDLKNTYGNIRITVRGNRVDSGRIKLGGIIADHVKASIGTLVYTGKKIGVASRIEGLVMEDVPSFVLYARTHGLPVWEISVEEAIKVAKRMMSRRKVEFTAADEYLLRKVFELTRREREEKKPRIGVFKYS